MNAKYVTVFLGTMSISVVEGLGAGLPSMLQSWAPLMHVVGRLDYVYKSRVHTAG